MVVTFDNVLNLTQKFIDRAISVSAFGTNDGIDFFEVSGHEGSESVLLTDVTLAGDHLTLHAAGVEIILNLKGITVAELEDNQIYIYLSDWRKYTITILD